MQDRDPNRRSQMLWGIFMIAVALEYKGGGTISVPPGPDCKTSVWNKYKITVDIKYGNSTRIQSENFYWVAGIDIPYWN